MSTEILTAIKRDATAYARIRERRKSNIARGVAEGLPMREIATAANMDAAYVRKIARDAGIAARPRGRKPKGAAND